MTALVEVSDLTLAYRGATLNRVLHGVSFHIDRGEVLGLVGESGCGKSTVGLTLLGYRFNTAVIEAGQVMFDGRDLLSLTRAQLDRVRGERIGFVPQNPTTALNPSMRVGQQMVETLTLHGRNREAGDAVGRAAELFDLVGLPHPSEILRRYPHELSGGQQQRICIAMAIACDPDLVVLDEPTTGLDVTTQEQIIALLVDLRARLGTSMLYVTHDLGLLSQIADRIGVMYAGHLVETAPSRTLFTKPRHPYTQGLIDSVPRIDDPQGSGRRPLRGLLQRRELPPGCPFAPRCDYAVPACAEQPQTLAPVAAGHAVACQRWQEIDDDKLAATSPAKIARRLEAPAPLLAVEGLRVAYGVGNGLIDRLLAPHRVVVVDDLSFGIGHGETFALVGESGSGKSTVARAISGLLPPVAGSICLDGAPIPPRIAGRTEAQRRAVQYIFQNPDASLNPRARVATILARPLAMFGTRGKSGDAIAQALSDVSLEASYRHRYPDELSGGERQRVAIARALIARPALLLCDEILSALDVSVQANIIALLRKLRAERDVAMLFISHDLSVVRTLADRVGVLFGGVLMEMGPVEEIFAAPFHPYTLSLLEAVPRIEAGGSPKAPPRAAAGERIAGAACAFAGRCRWQLGDKCLNEPPPWQHAGKDLAIRCHIPPDQLRRLAAEAAISATTGVVS